MEDTYSMPRSTSGIAVSIESELVTLPSSPGLRSTLYRGSRLLKRSSCAFPPGCAPGVVLAPGLSSDGCADPRRTFIFSSMYAILEWMSVLYCERRGVENVHMLVHIERIRLLCKVVRAHCTAHLGRFVFWLANKP